MCEMRFFVPNLEEKEEEAKDEAMKDDQDGEAGDKEEANEITPAK